MGQKQWLGSEESRLSQLRDKPAQRRGGGRLPQQKGSAHTDNVQNPEVRHSGFKTWLSYLPAVWSQVRYVLTFLCLHFFNCIMGIVTTSRAMKFKLDNAYIRCLSQLPFYYSYKTVKLEHFVTNQHITVVKVLSCTFTKFCFEDHCEWQSGLSSAKPFVERRDEEKSKLKEVKRPRPMMGRTRRVLDPASPAPGLCMVSCFPFAHDGLQHH